MSKRSSKAVALGVLPIMATAFIAGCGGDDETAYCTDENDVVVDNSYCDDDFGNNGFFWAFVGGSAARSYTKGSTLKGASSKIAASNKAALAAKGGFGSKSSSSGVGRTVSSSSSGGG